MRWEEGGEGGLAGVVGRRQVQMFAPTPALQLQLRAGSAGTGQHTRADRQPEQPEEPRQQPLATLHPEHRGQRLQAGRPGTNPERLAVLILSHSKNHNGTLY